eukprot:1944416-Rhodomonas_salina.5
MSPGVPFARTEKTQSVRAATQRKEKSLRWSFAHLPDADVVDCAFQLSEPADVSEQCSGLGAYPSYSCTRASRYRQNLCPEFAQFAE